MLLECIVEVEHSNHRAIESAATMLETEAKESLGHYQAGWPPLKPETIARKSTGDSPLLETGELRDSIQHNSTTSLGGAEAYVGTDNPVGIYQEFGTSRGIPPRSFMVSAAVRKQGEIIDEIGREVVMALRK